LSQRWLRSALERELGIQIRFQGHGVVVFGIVGAVEQRHGAVPGSIEDRLPSLGTPVELGEVLVLELGPFGRVMRKPFPQAIAGAGFLVPPVQGEISFPDPARPQALDEKALAIVRGPLIVDAFQMNHEMPLATCILSLP
jgi:hypothetical protein